MTVFPLIISWFLTFGYVPQMTDSVGGELICLEQSRIATVAQIGISAETKDGLFKIYTDLENFQYAPDGSSGASFSPFRINYSIGAQFRLNKNIRFNIEHQCDHPTTGIPDGNLPYHYNSDITTISVTLSGQTKLFGGK